MDYKALKWSVHDNPNNPGEPCIGVITLNRPERLNAVDPLMRLELDALCNEIARNSIVKVVILTGEGRGFCAGGDLTSEGEVLGAFEGSMGITGPYKEMAEYFFNDLRHRVLQSAMRKLEDLPQVTIAAINGPAVGVGLEMATLCDMRIASDRARFGEVAVPGRLRARKRRRAQFAQADRHRPSDASDSYRRDHRRQRSVAHRAGRGSRAGRQASRYRVRSCRPHRCESLFVRAPGQAAGENVLELEPHR